MSDEMTGADPEGTRVPPEGTPVPPESEAPPRAEAPQAPPVPPMPEARPMPAPAVPDAEVRRGMCAGGVLFGLLLVLIGVLTLTGGIGSVVDLVRLWPLLFVIGGIARMLNPRRDGVVKGVAEGLGSISVGLVLLGNTLGYLPWTVWFSIFSLWPLLIVAIGIELVGRGLHMDWFRALSNVVLILGLAYAVFVMQPAPARLSVPFVPAAATQSFSDSKPHDAAVTDGTADIKVGATKLTLGSGEALASISGVAPASDTPALAASVVGSDAVVTVETPSDHAVFIGSEDRTLDVKLDGTVRWSEVRLDVGAVSADADLRGLDVASIKLNVGASNALIIVGSRSDSVKVDVSGGATSVTVRIPQNAACTVNSTSGFSTISVPPSFRHVSGVVVLGNSSFVSQGTGGPKVDVTLASGVSDLRIETY